MRTSDAYLNCSYDEKINLLRYLLSAGQFNALDDLALLPLRNGTYIKFDRDNTSSCEIYMVPNSKIELLVGMEDRILSPLPKDVQDIFVTIVEEGERQYLYICIHVYVLCLANYARMPQMIIGSEYYCQMISIRWESIFMASQIFCCFSSCKHNFVDIAYLINKMQPISLHVTLMTL